VKHLVVYWRIATTVPFILVVGAMLVLRFAGPSQEATRADLDRFLSPSEMNGMGGVYYKGRSDGFDYFEKVRAYLGSDKVHIEVAHSPVLEPFEFTTDRRLWRQVGRMKLR
jgi:hypothetical protein